MKTAIKILIVCTLFLSSCIENRTSTYRGNRFVIRYLVTIENITGYFLRSMFDGETDYYTQTNDTTWVKSYIGNETMGNITFKKCPTNQTLEVTADFKYSRDGYTTYVKTIAPLVCEFPSSKDKIFYSDYFYSGR